MTAVITELLWGHCQGSPCVWVRQPAFPANLLSPPLPLGPQCSRLTSCWLWRKEGEWAESWVDWCPLSPLHMAPRGTFYRAVPLCTAACSCHSRLMRCTSCPAVTTPRLAGTAEGMDSPSFSSPLGSWGKEKRKPPFFFFYASDT